MRPSLGGLLAGAARRLLPLDNLRLVFDCSRLLALKVTTSTPSALLQSCSESESDNINTFNINTVSFVEVML